MKSHQLFGSLIAAALVSTSAFAQSTAPATGASLRGVRAAELGFGFVNPNNSGLNGYATNLAVNLPVAAQIDLGAEVTYGWVESHSDIDTTVASISATAYQDFSAARVFATVDVGHAWLPSPLGNEWIWDVRLGAEFNVCEKCTAIVSAGYGDSFDSGSEGSFDGTVRLNYRASEKVLPYVEVTNIEGGDWGAAIGVASAF